MSKGLPDLRTDVERMVDRNMRGRSKLNESVPGKPGAYPAWMSEEITARNQRKSERQVREEVLAAKAAELVRKVTQDAVEILVEHGIPTDVGVKKRKFGILPVQWGLWGVRPYREWQHDSSNAYTQGEYSGVPTIHSYGLGVSADAEIVQFAPTMHVHAEMELAAFAELPSNLDAAEISVASWSRELAKYTADAITRQRLG